MDHGLQLSVGKHRNSFELGSLISLHGSILNKGEISAALKQQQIHIILTLSVRVQVNI